jgi:tRNA-binding protein
MSLLRAVYTALNKIFKKGFVIMAEFKDFLKLDIRVAKIIKAEKFEEANDPAFKLWLDFGEKIGNKKSSAQITDLYNPEDLIDKQVLAVINFPPKQIADFMSEVLVLGVYGEKGVVLIEPEREVELGARLG